MVMSLKLHQSHKGSLVMNEICVPLTKQVETKAPRRQVIASLLILLSRPETGLPFLGETL
jgi:hypothetical protein